MKFDDLFKGLDDKKKRNRVGRGEGSGNGKTCGKGQKGQNSRSGGGVRRGFEGGQMPLHRRLPKRGFTNIFSKKYVIVDVEKLNVFEENSEITENSLKESGIVSKIKDGVVVLGRGEITKKIILRVKRCSESAKSKIIAAGGKVEENF
ncbi:MAG: 50S ribosomal protein L15 [Clostridiales bacterium]|nr:50S ribosomal protein L15 [Clostridiales bacterium]